MLAAIEKNRTAILIRDIKTVSLQIKENYL